MKTKYILQLKRRYFWEDVLVFHDLDTAYRYKLKLVSDGINCRVIEVVYI